MGEEWYRDDGVQLLWPYEFQSIRKLKVIHKFNDHARCYFTVKMTEEHALECLHQGSFKDSIIIQKKNESGTENWFAGGIQHVEMVVEDGIYYVLIEGISRSYELDLHPQSRSFQNKATTYTHIIKQLVQGHPKGDAKNEATEPGAVIGEFLVQYQETNWQFMKRLASRVGTVILPDVVMDAPRIYFGVPDFSWGKDIKAYSYTMLQDMGSYLSYQAQAAGNESLQLLEVDCIQYLVKSKQHYQVGENVGFKGQVWVIYNSKITYDQGSIVYEYVLVQRKAIRRKSKMNQAVQGLALEGTVVSRANNMVRVHLDMDDEYDESGNWWFPYSPEGNNIFHSLPEEGAKVKVYFPSGIEKQAIAINSSRGSNEEMISRTVFQKPTTKVFHIPGNTKMELGEDGVLFHKDTVKLDLEGGNIQVEASEDLLITVANKLELISQKGNETEQEGSAKSNTATPLPSSIKFTAKRALMLQILEEQFMLITDAFVAIRSKRIDFNKVEIPFVEMLTEDELKELYVDELNNDKYVHAKIYDEKWKEKQIEHHKANKAEEYITVSKEEIKEAIKARVYGNPNAIKDAKTHLGKIDEKELKTKYLTRGQPEDAAKPEEKSDEELAKIKSDYTTRYSQTNKLMSASHRIQNAKTDEEYKEASSQYAKVLEEIQKSGFGGDAAKEEDLRPGEYFSKNVPEMIYYSRFNFERIVISGQYGGVFFGIFSGVIGIIAVAASVFSAGTSILAWSFLVGDFLLSAGQLYISLEKMDDLGKGYGYTDPGIGKITQSDLDNFGLLLTAVNLSLLLKHGAMKTLDSATDATRLKWLDEVAQREGWDNVGKDFADVMVVDNRKINGLRASPYQELTEEQIKLLKEEIKALNADESVFRFNQGRQTAYNDKYDYINVRGDVLPDLNSTHPRDLMSTRAVLAHEYYGHRAYNGTKLPPGSWNDEFRASYMAAKNAPNLTDEDRIYLLLDAIERAKEAGVTIKYNDFMRRIIYGY
ncbi:contractile injection system protein, VgrG/Pvc8 family [Paenibacillus sanfengchensis]|uniref:contractile injection system protein, VgrG/Pvc8 family n=1 Tax=Paenibacillus sanfengchensis TaxID=3119819 RepID=UPI002FE1B1C9